jgi:peptide/nickel transport system substrate-binding protein
VQTFGAARSVLAAFVVAMAAGAWPVPASAATATATADAVRLPFPAYDGTLTPYTFGLGYPLVTLVYDTLLWRDEAGIPRPWLARSVTRSEDGLRLTVRLQDGVRWHDGRPLTAADVAFTFRYVASHYQPRFTPQLALVRRVRASGRLTATIELRRPSLGFDDQPLAELPILPRHRWQGLAAGRAAPRGAAVGSGPYRLVSAGPERGYVLRATDGYFRGDPRVREIRVPIIGDADRTYRALRDRTVDMVPLNLPAAAAADAAATLGVALRRGPSYVGTALTLNVRRAPFDRPQVRRAVAAALDVGRIARRAAPAVAADSGFVHPASRWSAGERLQRFDPLSARPVLARLGRPLRVLAPTNDPVRLEAGRQVVLALQQAGADATLVRLSRARLDRATGATGVPADFDAAIQTVPALVSYDPDYLTRLFGSDRRVAPLNIGGYTSERFDALARAVASAPDLAQRRRATAAELRLLARDVPAVPLFFSQGTFAYRSAVYDGWTFVKGAGILDKRSFLPGAAAAAPVREPQPADSGAETEDSGSGLSLLDVISLMVLAVVCALIVAALVTRRRGRR